MHYFWDISQNSDLSTWLNTINIWGQYQDHTKKLHGAIKLTSTSVLFNNIDNYVKWAEADLSELENDLSSNSIKVIEQFRIKFPKSS